MSVEDVRKIPDAVIAGANEPWLLKVYSVWLERENPAIDGKKAIADMLGKSTKHVEMAMAGETYIGTDAWFRLQLAGDTDLYTRWLNLTYLRSKPL